MAAAPWGWAGQSESHLNPGAHSGQSIGGEKERAGQMLEVCRKENEPGFALDLILWGVSRRGKQ